MDPVSWFESVAHAGAHFGGAFEETIIPAACQGPGRAFFQRMGEFIGMGSGLATADRTVETALAEWRRRAADALIVATAIAYFPPIVLMLAGQGPRVAWAVNAAMLIVYVVVLLCAVLRHVDPGLRAACHVAAGYFITVVGTIAVPEGPFVRAMPVVLPVMVLVLFGIGAGRAATLASVCIILLAPLLHGVPSLEGILTTAADRAPMRTGLIWTQGLVLTALLAALMILLERFHQVLIQSLTELEQEAAGRRDAYRDLECEMAERRRLEREVARAADEERRRLGLEIHDGVCQQLTGALLRSEAMARRLGRGEAPDAGDFTALSALLEETIDEAHAVALGLCPLDPDPGALEAALRTLATRTRDASGIGCYLEVCGNTQVSDSAVAQHLYRIAQEAVNNAVRHARARRITMALRGDDGLLSLEVEDDGDGMPPTRSDSGMGLRAMAYRAGLVEGELAVTAVPSGGTRISCRMPRVEPTHTEGTDPGTGGAHNDR